VAVCRVAWPPQDYLKAWVLSAQIYMYSALSAHVPEERYYRGRREEEGGQQGLFFGSKRREPDKGYVCEDCLSKCQRGGRVAAVR
jgi:hypothetical protein